MQSLFCAFEKDAGPTEFRYKALTKAAVCDILALINKRKGQRSTPMQNRAADKKRCDVIIAGNILTDRVKVIDTYPERRMLANILSASVAVGGCVPNTATDLKIIDPSLSVGAAGRIGDDEAGKFVLSQLQKIGIDTGYVKVSGLEQTSFSDVMSEAKTGERTFFHYRGANADFCPDDLPVNELGCRMLHIGYIMLLDKFDVSNGEYGTEMAKFLCKAQEAGIKTSVDAVSDSNGGFAEKIIPALRYTDNAIMNETEACAAVGLSPRKADGSLDIENIRLTAQKLLSYGVRERVIIHAPEAGFIFNASGEFTAVPSLQLPDGFIKGSVGAGDAFCAGCLYGIYHGFSDRRILEFASGAAASSLFAEDSVSGMRPADEIEALISHLPRKKL